MADIITMDAEQFAFSVLLRKYSDELEEFTPVAQFYQIPKLFERFKASEHAKLENTCFRGQVEAYLLDRKSLIEALKSHDYTHMYSDDHRVWERGAFQLKEIQRRGKLFSNEETVALWNRYCPKSMQR